jgi:hypothetical protein
VKAVFAVHFLQRKIPRAIQCQQYAAIKHPILVYHPLLVSQRTVLAKHFPKTDQLHPVHQRTYLVIAQYFSHLEQRSYVVSALPLLHRLLKIQYRRMLKEKHRKLALYPVLDFIVLIVLKRLPAGIRTSTPSKLLGNSSHSSTPMPSVYRFL